MLGVLALIAILSSVGVRGYLLQAAIVVTCVLTAFNLPRQDTLGPVPVADTDVDACYGKTLDFLFVKHDATGAELERTSLSLPNPGTWLIRPVGQSDVLQNIPCQKEPIETDQVVGTFVEPRLGQVADVFGPPDGIRMWQLHIVGGGPGALGDYQKAAIGRVVNSNPTTIAGFLYQRWHNRPPYGGGWVFPAFYTSPTGELIGGHCIGGFHKDNMCDVQYSYDSNLYVLYSFVVEDEQKLPPWIEVDQMVRRQIAAWIVK